MVLFYFPQMEIGLSNINVPPATQKCLDVLNPFYELCFSQPKIVNFTCDSITAFALEGLCYDMYEFEDKSNIESVYSKPMVLIGVYISIASLFCILPMTLDLLSGFRNRKFWFPTKYFSLNAASITVITVAMKLPVDLTSAMPLKVEQAAKLGSLAFMCTMMSNFMPSLASMDNKSLLANVIGSSILVITLIVNISIQIKTQVIVPVLYIFSSTVSYLRLPIVAIIHMGMLLFLLIIMISSAITLPTSKKILEVKYQAITKKTLNDQNPQAVNIIEKLRRVVKRYWIMAETGSPQFVMASNQLSYASGIICAITMLVHLVFMCLTFLWHTPWNDLVTFGCVYKWSILAILITQSIGIVVGSIAPICRCFTLLSFISSTNQNRNHFFEFKVERYWTQKLCEWKENHISFLSSGRRSRVVLHNLKNIILSFCIVCQKVIVVSCKIIRLIPVVVIIFFIYCSSYFKSVKPMMLPTSNDDHRNEDLSSCVLLLEENMPLAKRTMKGISDSMDRLINEAEKKQRKNLLKLLEKSGTFDGVEAFDTDQVQSLLSVNSWSLPIISLTCIAITLPTISTDMVDNLLRSVSEGLSYTHLVDESLNTEDVYVNIRRATVTLWHEVEDNYKWLETTLKRSAYEGKKATHIVKQFASIAEKIVNELMGSTGGEPVEKDKLPSKIIAANSMYRIAHTIMHTYESNDSEITEKELFKRLSNMIADILSACLTNIPQVVEIRCHESVIEKREASVKAAVDFLGRTTQIIEMLETRGRPNIDADKMGFIDEWRLHLKHLRSQGFSYGAK